MNVPKHETARHLEAFEIYHKLGSARTLQKVSKKCGKSRSWVEKIAKQFNWDERVAQRDQAVSEESLDDYDKLRARAKRENFQIIRAVKAELVKKIKAIQQRGGNMEVSLGDYEKLAKLEMLMLGDPTERVSDDTIAGIIRSATEHQRKNQNQGEN